MPRALPSEIERLQRSLLGVAGRVEEQVLASVRVIETRDVALAKKVREADRGIDRLEVEIEEECLRALALHRPTGSELRMLIAILKINHDLEGIGDLAVNIADRGKDLARQDPIAIPFPLSEMAATASAMLKASLDALVNMDSEAARGVCVLDDAVDAIHRQAYTEVEARIHRNIEHVGRLIQLLSVAKNVERVADLASSIAKDVVYIVEGKIVRHRHVAPAATPTA